MDGVERKEIIEEDSSPKEASPDRVMIDLSLKEKFSEESNSNTKRNVQEFSPSHPYENDLSTPKSNLRKERINNTRPILTFNDARSLTTVMEDSESKISL